MRIPKLKKLDNRQLIAVSIGFSVLIMDFILFSSAPIFSPLIVLAVLVGSAPWWVDFLAWNKKQRELESKFLEFVRNLVGAVKSGMPMGRAIMHVSTQDYGALNPYVQKLSNKIEWSIPLHKALVSFGNDTRNKVIKRAIATVIEAEQSGGNIEDVLESMTESLIEIKKLRDKRRASVQSQVLQSYVIYIVFLIIMVVIQNFMIPWLSGVQAQTEAGTLGITGEGTFETTIQKVEIDLSSFDGFIFTTFDWLLSIHGVFLMMALIQGLFAGLVIGKLSEGTVSYGWKHSIILMTLSLVIITFSQAL